MIDLGTLGFIVVMLFAHFLGDFLCQSRVIAENKSVDMSYLVLHGMIVGGFVFLGLLPFYSIGANLTIVYSYMILHTLQDWFIWRAYKGKFESPIECEDVMGDNEFWTVLGFDQCLHLLVLFTLIHALG